MAEFVATSLTARAKAGIEPPDKLKAQKQALRQEQQQLRGSRRQLRQQRHQEDAVWQQLKQDQRQQPPLPGKRSDNNGARLWLNVPKKTMAAKAAGVAPAEFVVTPGHRLDSRFGHCG
ncbi:MAG: hypothetical protein U0401_00705 [Anaerolineae bacterium]